MAVVFISPKQKQKMFFWGITAVFLLFIVSVSFLVFLSEPKQPTQTVAYNKSKVNVDMSVFDTDQFKKLQPIAEMKIQYSYKATTKDNKPKNGSISAGSEEEARTILEKKGLTVSEIKEVNPGRKNPFVPYYQVNLPDKPSSESSSSQKTKTINIKIGG